MQMMQVKCYDCGQMVSQGEAIKQKEGSGNLGGGGYGHKSGWGGGVGHWQSAGKSYWLCINCDRKREANRRFWTLIILAICLGVVIVGLIFGRLSQ